MWGYVGLMWGCNPTPATLHPATLHLQLCTCNPAPATLHLQLCNPAPATLQPLQPCTCKCCKMSWPIILSFMMTWFWVLSLWCKCVGNQKDDDMIFSAPATLNLETLDPATLSPTTLNTGPLNHSWYLIAGREPQLIIRLPGRSVVLHVKLLSCAESMTFFCETCFGDPPRQAAEKGPSLASRRQETIPGLAFSYQNRRTVLRFSSDLRFFAFLIISS